MLVCLFFVLALISRLIELVLCTLFADREPEKVYCWAKTEIAPEAIMTQTEVKQIWSLDVVLCIFLPPHFSDTLLFVGILESEHVKKVQKFLFLHVRILKSKQMKVVWKLCTGTNPCNCYIFYLFNAMKWVADNLHDSGYISILHL